MISSQGENALLKYLLYELLPHKRMFQTLFVFLSSVILKIKDLTFLLC